MRNLLKKLQMVPDDSGVRTPLLTLPGWFSSAARRGADLPAPSSSSSSASSSSTFTAPSSSAGMSALDEEEHQIHLALELSMGEEPEAVQIEAVQQISLGELPAGFTPAEVVAFRYWNHNTIGYDDKILDGFYDLYGILPESASMKMPSLVDLQRILVSGSVCWEAVLVNRPGDPDLLMLEKKALKTAHELQLGAVDYTNTFLEGLCILVANVMGGSVHDNAQMLEAWRSQSSYLRTSIQSNVLPLGLLTVGLARHRALLFKVLADAVGIPCRLVKGELGAGLDCGVRTIVKLNDDREYIVDLMEEPGVLIPSDASGVHNINNGKKPSLATSGGDTHITLSGSDYSSLSYTTTCNDIKKKASVVDAYATSESDGCIPGAPMGEKMKKLPYVAIFSNEYKDDNSCVSVDQKNPWNDDKALQNCLSLRPTQACALVKSPSWTEGVNSSKFRKKKVKDVSRYMIDATKENPKLAQRIHDVLLESGVAVPPHLFTEISRQERENAKGKIADGSLKVYKNVEIGSDEKSSHNELTEIVSTCLPNSILKPTIPSSTSETKCSKPIFDGRKLSLNVGELPVISAKSQMEESSVQAQDSPIKFIDNMAVSAAVAAAAIVASSMVVAVAKSTTGSKIETTAAATATAAAAAAVIASTAVSKQHEQLPAFAHPPLITHNEASAQEEHGRNSKNDHNGCVTLQEYPPKGDAEVNKVIQEMERTSDRSSGSGSERSDVSHDDVGELEIPWEEITLGDRIGIGSYGEVYRGEWHGTEVAVKRFLDQDMSGDALEEFKSEVQIMRKLRHPNVVLLMGAITHMPNLSIVTEFLPRGSLYRLIHRPNNQIDERRRLKMALDVARGMNYLHNCSPVVVHRDLKSPNLLVDKNWVVKVCDFGLSRVKQNTFLSSRSTAGTAEWMSPEMLRNEPSTEKCDVFSFGVILWELYTLQQPWKGMNSMQVVGAVGFQHRRLDIPKDINPAITDIILKCWQTDPQKRPSFSEIMESLKSLQKPASSSPSAKPKRPPSS